MKNVDSFVQMMVGATGRIKKELGGGAYENSEPYGGIIWAMFNDGCVVQAAAIESAGPDAAMQVLIANAEIRNTALLVKEQIGIFKKCMDSFLMLDSVQQIDTAIDELVDEIFDGDNLDLARELKALAFNVTVAKWHKINANKSEAII